MSDQRFALFVFTTHEAIGGARDHVLTGSMDECMQEAEKSHWTQECHIAQMSNLRIVKSAEWVKSPDGRLTLTWEDE